MRPRQLTRGAPHLPQVTMPEARETVNVSKQGEVFFICARYISRYKISKYGFTIKAGMVFVLCSLHVTFISDTMVRLLPPGRRPSVPGRRQHCQAWHPEDEGLQSRQAPGPLLSPTSVHNSTRRYSFFLFRSFVSSFISDCPFWANRLYV
jgi:hypothetical protein